MKFLINFFLCKGETLKKGQCVDAVCMDTKCSLREDPISFGKQNIYCSESQINILRESIPSCGFVDED